MTVGKLFTSDPSFGFEPHIAVVESLGKFEAKIVIIQKDIDGLGEDRGGYTFITCDPDSPTAKAHAPEWLHDQARQVRDILKVAQKDIHGGAQL